jgi:uncharacterized protein YqhQ
MPENENLKKRLQQLDIQVNKFQNDQKQSTKEIEPTKKLKLKIALKYKLLIWFVVGLGIFTILSLIVGSQTLYLYIASIMLFITELSFLAILLLFLLPTILLIYVIYRVWRWIV